VKSISYRFLAYHHRGEYLLEYIIDTCKVESSQKRAQSTHSMKACRKSSAFNTRNCFCTCGLAYFELSFTSDTLRSSAACVLAYRSCAFTSFHESSFRFATARIWLPFVGSKWCSIMVATIFWLLMARTSKEHALI